MLTVVLTLVGLMFLSGTIQKIFGEGVISAMNGISPYLTVGAFLVVLFVLFKVIRRRKK